MLGIFYIAFVFGSLLLNVSCSEKICILSNRPVPGLLETTFNLEFNLFAFLFATFTRDFVYKGYRLPLVPFEHESVKTKVISISCFEIFRKQVISFCFAEP